jgi:hypothetical protein
MVFDDIAKSVKAQLYERVGSPLFSSFLFSWAAWNYKFILIVVSSMPTIDKIAYIDDHLFPTLRDFAFRGGLFPLLTALGLIFLYPIPAKYVYQHWRKRQKELKEIQQKIDDETPLTKEEARQIRRDALAVSLEYDRGLQSKEAEITRLKEIIGEMQKLNPVKTDHDANMVASGSNGLDENQLKMLEKIARSTPLKSDFLNNESDRILDEYNLGELINGAYVSQNMDHEAEEYRLFVTHAGRKAIINRPRTDEERP